MPRQTSAYMADLLENFPEASGGYAVSFGSLLTTFWLAGLLLAAIYFITSYISGRKNFQTSLPVDVEWLSTWRETLGIPRRIDIRVSDKISSPLTYGLIHPVILLPKRMDWQDTEAIRCILIHEYIHIRHLDGAAKILLAATFCIHWWNPLVWVLYILANRDMELACDEAAIRTLGINARSRYALAIIRMAEIKNHISPLYNHFSKNAYEERITAIMKIKNKSVAGIALALLIVVGTTVAFATSALPKPDDIDSGKIPTDQLDALTDQPDALTDQIGALADQLDTPPMGEKPTLLWPAENCTWITATFDETGQHPGSDHSSGDGHITISALDASAAGADVFAAASGTVSQADFDVNRGNFVLIDHGDGLQTLYTHCETLTVNAGSTVKQGDVIATVGKSGMATGPCLGFHVYKDGVAENPLTYFSDDVLDTLSHPE